MPIIPKVSYELPSQCGEASYQIIVQYTTMESSSNSSTRGMIFLTSIGASVVVLALISIVAFTLGHVRIISCENDYLKTQNEMRITPFPFSHEFVSAPKGEGVSPALPSSTSTVSAGHLSHKTPPFPPKRERHNATDNQTALRPPPPGEVWINERPPPYDYN